MNKIIQARTVAPRLVLAAALALPLLHAGTAAAEDQMNAGAACVAEGSGGTLEINSKGEALNAGTSTLTLICPIARGSFGVLGSMAATVLVTDAHSSQDVVCSARSRNAGSSSFLVSTSDDTNGIISQDALGMSVANGGSADYRFIRCSLPPVFNDTLGAHKSILHGYRGVEL